jgi:ABC-type transport system involved in multi-copper enzyme maturation permease subunit
MTLIATIGSLALYLLFAWLLSAIIASYLSGRKGYGEKVGIASGLLLSVIGVIVWLVVPARDGSSWKRDGAFGSAKRTMAADDGR